MSQSQAVGRRILIVKPSRRAPEGSKPACLEKKKRFVPKYLFTPFAVWCLKGLTVPPHLLSDHMAPVTLLAEFAKCLHPFFSIAPLRESPEVDPGTVSVVQVLLCSRDCSFLVFVANVSVFEEECLLFSAVQKLLWFDEVSFLDLSYYFF